MPETRRTQRGDHDWSIQSTYSENEVAAGVPQIDGKFFEGPQKEDRELGNISLDTQRIGEFSSLSGNDSEIDPGPLGNLTLFREMQRTVSGFQQHVAQKMGIISITGLLREHIAITKKLLMLHR